MTYESRILDIMPGERIVNSYVLAAAGERFSVSLTTVEFLPDGTATLLRLTKHGAYFDGNPEDPQMRVHGIGKRLDLLGRVLPKATPCQSLPNLPSGLPSNNVAWGR